MPAMMYIIRHYISSTLFCNKSLLFTLKDAFYFASFKVKRKILGGTGYLSEELWSS